MLVGAEFDSDPLATLRFSRVFGQLVQPASPFHSFPGVGFVLSARRLPGDFLPPIFQECSLRPCGGRGRQSGPQPGLPALRSADYPVPRPERPRQAHPRVLPMQECRTPVFWSPFFFLPFTHGFMWSVSERVLSTRHGLALCVMLRIQ